MSECVFWSGYLPCDTILQLGRVQGASFPFTSTVYGGGDGFHGWQMWSSGQSTDVLAHDFDVDLWSLYEGPLCWAIAREAP